MDLVTTLALAASIVALSFGVPAAEALNPLQFGAVGDGSTDDTDALRETFASGTLIQIPDGYTFVTRRQIYPQSNTKVFGRGSIKLADGSDTNLFYINTKSNMHISGVTLDGNRTNQLAGNGFIVRNSEGVTITGTKIVNVYNDAILSDESTLFDYSNNRIENTGGHAVSLAGDSWAGDAESNYGIVAENLILNPGNAGVNASESSFVAITGNTVLHNGSEGNHTRGHGGIRLSNGSRNIAVTGNTVRGMSRGVFLIQSTDSAVMGNTIADAWMQGVLIDDNASAIGADAASARNVVQGNTIRNPATGAMPGSTAGIQISASNANLVSGNIITDSEGRMTHGVLESSGATANFIFDNMIIGSK